MRWRESGAFLMVFSAFIAQRRGGGRTPRQGRGWIWFFVILGILTATAITSRSGQKKKRAMPDNAASRTLLTNEVLMRMAHSRGKVLALPAALSHRPLWSASGKTRSKILAGDGTEDARVARFLNSTLRWRITRTGNELTWPTTRLWRSKESPSMKPTTSGV